VWALVLHDFLRASGAGVLPTLGWGRGRAIEQRVAYISRYHLVETRFCEYNVRMGTQPWTADEDRLLGHQ